MTVLKYTAVFTVALALILGALAASLPFTASAINAPRCVLNTIVQPFNNGGTTLSWKVYDAHTVELSSVGFVSDADSIVVYPTSVTQYTLTATGNGGVDTCTVTVQPTSAYPNIGNSVFGSHFAAGQNQNCSIRISPDYVVPGGTAVLTWNAGSAVRTTITPGIGNVGNAGSRVVPNTGITQVYTLTSEFSNGATRTCSATLRPGAAVAPAFAAGTYIGNTFTPVSQHGLGNTAFGAVAPQPVATPIGAPQITANYTAPTVSYVPLSHVPYTGPNDVAYVLTLLMVAVAAFATLFMQRRTISSALASFSETDNDDTVSE